MRRTKILLPSCFFLITLCFVISACSSSRIVPASFKSSSKSMALNMPTCEEFTQIVQDKISKIDAVLRDNEGPLNKNKKWANGLTIGGSLVGLGGGIYGVATNNEQKGAAITSLISGTITGLVAIFNARSNERASDCIEAIKGIKFQYEWKWKICPKTPEEWKNFQDEEAQISATLEKLKCFKPLE